MKKLFTLLLIVAGSLVANSAYSQVQVRVGFYERHYPGHAYYTYPAWRGHYHDHIYYSHYHTTFEREHQTYFTGRRFDHDRFERENHWHGRN